ncbi:MAG: carboxypeptidase M32, partial [Verrucomicrobia bacterium]|nr:carboxypeptidase M32 [Verrucomicrobiota bacterium]
RAQAMRVWATARQQGDFSLFRPWLEKILDQQRQAARMYGYEGDIYDALLEGFEPGMTVARLDPMLAAVRERMVLLLESLTVRDKRPDRSLLSRCYPIEKQMAFARDLARAVGFDFEAGRLEKCGHAFTEAIAIGDVRMTIRCVEDDPLASIYCLLHEVGHGLYEQGFVGDHESTPMAQAVSGCVHESQSRLWENMVGRSRAFWQFALPRFKTAFSRVADDIDLETIYQCATEVRPTLRRVGSDEVTYNLHIILRYELERDLLNARIQVADLPALWRERMTQYLGLIPPNDGVGVLQDVHWSMYDFGCFTTYALGNLYAGQIYQAMRRDLPDLDEQIARGEFLPLREWLRNKIHRHGMRYQAAELIEKVTGQPPASGPFLEYISKKYSKARATQDGSGRQIDASTID